MPGSVSFAARDISAWPLVGFVLLGAAVLALLRGGVWLVAGPIVGAVVIVAALFRPKGTVLVVDADGFDDRRLGIGRVMWHHVESIDRVVVHGAPYINIHLTPAGKGVVVPAWWRRCLTPLLRLQGIAPLHVAAAGLDATADEVFAAVFHAYTRTEAARE